MQPATLIAENHITITRKLFNEGMRAVENKAYKKDIRRLTLLLAVLYSLIALWILYTNGSLFLLLGESVFLAALLFWLFIMLPGTKRKNKYKAMTQGRNIAPERTIRFYQDHMSVIAKTGETTEIAYQEITGWQETDNLYVLNCINKRSVLVSKSGFTFGNLDSIKSIFPDNK